ncbi:MAG: hypothetical protein ABJM26_16420 [Anderseniella sp.]
MVKIGDRVRLVAIPDGLPPDDKAGALGINSLFQRCLGGVFPVVDINELGWAELEVGEVNGQPPYMDSIRVEPRCLVVVE